jgi:hypothetical protein
VVPGFDAQVSHEVVIHGDRVVMTGFHGFSAGVWVGPAP